MIYNNMKKPVLKRFLIIIGLFLIVFALTSCGGKGKIDYDVKTYGSRIQFIVPLNTVEAVEDITAKRELSVILLEDFSIPVNDKWELKNNSDTEKSFTVAYAIGQQRLSERKIKLNGEDAENRLRVGYRLPQNTDGTEKEDTAMEKANKLINREYLQAALDQPDGFISYKDALIYYDFVDVTIPAGESIEMEFDYWLEDTYRLNFIAGKYCDVDCEETVFNLTEKGKIVIVKQTLGLDETADISTVTLDPDKEDYYIDFRRLMPN